MFNIVLIEPEIPQNTGNISRTCACTETRLHLVRPYGFELSDRTVKRAGLDYWDKLDVTEYDSIEDFFARNKGGEFYYFSTKAKKRYTDEKFPDGCYLIFGKETKGVVFLENHAGGERSGRNSRVCFASWVLRLFYSVL